MTLDLKKGDRIYKIIEASTFGSERKRIISKIDKDGKITVLTYIFGVNDLKEDMTVGNEDKRMMLLIKDIDEQQFRDVINTNYGIYPQFKILLEKDYSDKNLADAIELMNMENIIHGPIKDFLKEMRSSK